MSAARDGYGASAQLPAGRVPAASPESEARQRLTLHWRKTRRLTGALLALWLLVTFGVGFFAWQLEQIRFFGWPLSYYMGAQGALILFLLIIACYALVMNRLDREARADAAAAAPGDGVPR